MKRLPWITICLVLLSLLALPAFAQRPEKPPRGEAPRAGEGPQARPWPGRIIEMAPQQRQLKIALYILAASKDAPGKVPAEMAQKAATFTTDADRLDANGNAKLAQRLRALAEECLRWREVEYTLTAPIRVPIMVMNRTSIDQIPVGSHVLLLLGTEAEVPANQVPERLTLQRDISPANPNKPFGIHRLPAGPRVTGTMFDLVAEVTAVNPFTVRVFNQTIVVDTPQQYGFNQTTAAQQRDLQPGTRIMATVRMREELEIDSIQHILINPRAMDGMLNAWENARRP